MRIRSLAPEGVHRFRELLDRLRAADNRMAEWTAMQPELKALRDGELARTSSFDAEIDDTKTFPTRYEMGKYLVSALKHCDQASLETDAGLWSWLALVWLAQLVCDDQSRPLTKIPENENFVPPETPGGTESTATMWRTWHRHAVRTTYLLVREYGEEADFLLCNPMHTRGELIEQLTGRADLLPCPSVVKAMALLYRDPRTGRPRRGAAGKDHAHGPSRRFAYLMKQYMVNYDLHSMSAEEIVAMLPPEFERFRAGTPATSTF